MGNKPEKLVELIDRDKKHVALITNAADQFPDEGIVERLKQDQELLEHDEIAYGGYSAGACVMGLTLHGLELVDDAQVTPAGYESDTIWDGLNILPYAIAPHYKSDHPESALIDDAIRYFEEHHIVYKALHDDEAILVDGNQESIVA